MVVKGRESWHRAVCKAHGPGTSVGYKELLRAEAFPGWMQPRDNCVQHYPDSHSWNSCFQGIKKFSEVSQDLSHIHRERGIAGYPDHSTISCQCNCVSWTPLRLKYFSKIHLFLFYVCVICLYVCAHCVQDWCLQRPEENTGPSQVGVKENFKLCVCAANRTQVLWKIASPLNCSAISPALQTGI